MGCHWFFLDFFGLTLRNLFFFLFGRIFSFFFVWFGFFFHSTFAVLPLFPASRGSVGRSRSFKEALVQILVRPERSDSTGKTINTPEDLGRIASSHTNANTHTHTHTHTNTHTHTHRPTQSHTESSKSRV